MSLGLVAPFFIFMFVCVEKLVQRVFPACFRSDERNLKPEENENNHTIG
jgi:hypothetical protein